MATTIKDLGIDRLGVDERLQLMFEIWDSICAESDGIQLSEAQRSELQRRIAEHEASPDDVVPWEDIKREALARIHK